MVSLGSNKQSSSSTSTGSNYGYTGSLNQTTGGSIGQSGGGSTQNVWGPQQNALQNLYGSANTVLADANTDIANYRPHALRHQQWLRNQAAPAYSQQAGGGVLGGQDIAGLYTRSLQDEMASPSRARTAFDDRVGPGGSIANMEDMYIRQADKAQNQMLNKLDARAAAAGASGGSRHGVAIARGSDDINTNLQNLMASTGYDAYNRDLDRNLAIAGQDDTAAMQRLGLMQGDITGQNTAMLNALGQTGQLNDVVLSGFQPYQMGLQNLGMGAQIIGGPTVLSDAWNQSTNLGFNQGMSGSFGENYGLQDSTSSGSGRGFSAGIARM